MSTQAPINADVVLEKAEIELALQIAGIQKIVDGLKQAGIDGTKEWESFSYWKRSWSWCDSAEKWSQMKQDHYDWDHNKEWKQRKRSKACAEGLIQLATATSKQVMLSSDHANFLNISDDS